MSRQWTKESAEKMIKSGGEGLSRCSAMDFYKKTYGAAELNKLIVSPNAERKIRVNKKFTTEKDEIKAEIEEAVAEAPKAIENKKPEENEKPAKTFEKKEKKQYALTASIGSMYSDFFNSFKHKRNNRKH